MGGLVGQQGGARLSLPHSLTHRCFEGKPTMALTALSPRPSPRPSTPRNEAFALLFATTPALCDALLTGILSFLSRLECFSRDAAVSGSSCSNCPRIRL